MFASACKARILWAPTKNTETHVCSCRCPRYRLVLSGDCSCIIVGTYGGTRVNSSIRQYSESRYTIPTTTTIIFVAGIKYFIGRYRHRRRDERVAKKPVYLGFARISAISLALLPPLPAPPPTLLAFEFFTRTITHAEYDRRTSCAIRWLRVRSLNKKIQIQ